MAMESYIDQLKADTAEANSQHQEAKAKRGSADPRVLCDKSLALQVSEYMLSLPPALRSGPFSLLDLRCRMKGRYVARASAGDLGIALSALGYVRKRDYSNNGSGRRFWVPPSGG